MTRQNWLRDVASILRAETGDLRELARIGGADPRTLYVGTTLEGVDIRGQDLRGMNLPGLDPGRVRMDAYTLLEGPAESEAETTDALIYLSRPADVGLLHRLDIPVRTFAGEADTFLHACHQHRGPIVLVANEVDGSSRTLEVAYRLHAGGRSFVPLMMDRAHDEAARVAFADAARTFGSLAVVLTAATVAGRRQPLTREAIEAAAQIVERWEGRAEFLDPGVPTYYIQARGLGSDPGRDAAGEIFDRAARAGLFVHGAKLVRSRSRHPRLHRVGSEPTMRTLLQGLRFLPDRIGSPVDDKVGAWGGFASDVMTDDLYAQTLARALMEEGWASEWERTPRGTRLRLEHPYGRFDLLAVLRPHGANRLIRTPHRSHFNLRLSGLSRVELSPHASVVDVVDRLAFDRLLLISGRDLLGAGRSFGGIWALIASQVRRMVDLPDSPARGRYFDILLRDALLEGRVDMSVRGVLEHFLEASEGAVRRMISGFQEDQAFARFRLRMEPSSGSGARIVSAEGLHLSITIDASGAHVTPWTASPRSRGRGDGSRISGS